MSTVTPLSSIPPLGSSTQRQGGQKQEGQPQKSVGETLRATVLEARGGDRYLMQIGDNRILARSQAPLSAGQQLSLQITRTTPQIELKIVTDVFSTLTGKSLVLLGENINLSSLFNELHIGSPSPFSSLSSSSSNTLETFLPSELLSIIKSDGGGVFLQRLFNRLGLNMENLLAQGEKQQATSTLKAALLDIAHLFQGSERIADQANKLLATLELYQLAQIQLQSERLFIFPLPLSFLEQGYLLIENNRQGQQDDGEPGQEQRFSLHLTLSGLGNMRISFLQTSQDLYIRFDLDSRDKAAFVASYEDDLKQAVSGARIVSLSFSDTAEDPAAELVRKLIPREQSMLDTTV